MCRPSRFFPFVLFDTETGNEHRKFNLYFFKNKNNGGCGGGEREKNTYLKGKLVGGCFVQNGPPANFCSGESFLPFLHLLGVVFETYTHAHAHKIFIKGSFRQLSW